MATLNVTQWAAALLQRMGAPTTSAMIDFIVRWVKSEGGWGSPQKFNPLNVAAWDNNPTNPQSVMSSWDQGLTSTAKVLQQNNMSSLYAGIMSGNATQAQQALIASPWASSHYNGGRNFATTSQGYGTNSISDNSGPLGTASGPSGPYTSIAPYAPTTNYTPSIDSATLAASYGYSAAMINGIPELKSLFSSAVAGGWTADKFIAAVQNTSWYRANSDSQRKWTAQGYLDPATQAQSVTMQTVSIQTAASRMGAPLNDSVARSLAISALQGNWNADQISRAIAGYIQWDSYGHLGGAAGQEEMTLRELANKNGASISDQWILDAARQIGMGQSSIEKYEGDIRTMAAQQYPAYADQIQKGINLEDLASPYAVQLQKILETSPESSKLTDPQMQQALQYRDPTSGAPAVMPLWEFQQNLRADNRWLGTQNAQDSLMSTGHQVLKDFGFQF